MQIDAEFLWQIWTSLWLVGWLCFTSYRQRGYLEKVPPFTVPCESMWICFYTVPTRNRNPGRRMAVHYTTAAPRKLHNVILE